MTATPQPVRVICPACFGRNPRCATCFGAEYVIKHPYARGGGEQGDDFADLHSPTDGGGAFGLTPAGTDREKPSDARGGDDPSPRPSVVLDVGATFDEPTNGVTGSDVDA